MDRCKHFFRSKKVYASKREAKHDAKFLGFRKRVRVQVFLCRFCEHWYVGAESYLSERPKSEVQP